MNVLKRISSGLVAKVEWLADRAENHEALINATIKDIEHAAAKARVQFRKVQRDSANLKSQLENAHEAEGLWTERAERTARSGEEDGDEKALECLKRRKALRKKIEKLQEQNQQQEELEQRLSKDLLILEERLRGLRQRRNLLVSRAATSKAIGALDSSDRELFEDIESIFDRWEISISSSETLCAHEDTLAGDTLEAEFESEELTQELKRELEELRK